MTKQTFKLTKDHLKLLKAMWVGWSPGEAGAPAVDSKRPYGNSDYINDIAELLDIEITSDSTVGKLETLHMETATALQICLSTQSFKPGLYRMEELYDDTSWKLVK